MIDIAESIQATQPKLDKSSVDMGGVVVISMPNTSSGVAHDLTFQFEGGTLYSIATNVGSTHMWIVPDLSEKIPNSTRGTIQIRCTTKSGSKVIGTKTVSLIANVPLSVVPVINSVIVAEAAPGIELPSNTFLQGKSKIQVSISADGEKGSTILSYRATFHGKTYTGNNWTSDTIAGYGLLPVEVIVTDSRGRTSVIGIGINVLEYESPKISVFTAYRCDEDGAEQNNGEYVAISYAYSACSVSNRNTATMEVYYKQSTDGFYESTAIVSDTALVSTKTVLVTNPTFSTDYHFDLKMTVTDRFGSSTSYIITLPSGSVIIDLAADGLGIAIGKTSERQGIELGWKIYGLADRIVEEGYTSDWYYRKFESGVAECWTTGKVTEVNAAANHYSGFYYSDIITISFPFSFLEIISGSCDGGSNNFINFLRTGRIDLSEYRFWVCGLSEDAKSIDVNYRIHVIGRITARPEPISNSAIAGIAIAGAAIAGTQ